MDRYETTHDFRKRPVGDPNNLFVDVDFPYQKAIEDTHGKQIEWKRPRDFIKNPALFTDGTTRCDVGQGLLGNCWFLSTVASIAQDAALMRQVIPDGAYRIETEAYDGIFHARFYRFGKWEDVFIDDYLPVIYGNKLWGAKSISDPREMWVPLLEKAFAKLFGSYDAIAGGQSADAYLLLTGYISEKVKLNVWKPDDFYKRIIKTLDEGFFAACSVPIENDGKCGLIGGHTYSLVGAEQFNGYTLLRVRNPWGKREWTGAWSDGSREWQMIPQDKIPAPNKDDGEFFISHQDFFKYFDTYTICSPLPDFDMDGTPEPLNYVTRIYGKWEGSTAAGNVKRLNNPKFCFTLTDRGKLSNGTISVFLQCIQQSKHRQSDNVPIRCDIFQIVKDQAKSDTREFHVRVQGEDVGNYYADMAACFRYSLAPGTYMIVPSTFEANKEKSFLLRLFTPAPVYNIRRIPDYFTVLWVK